MRTKNGQMISIEKADKADLPEILSLQCLAYQSEARLLNDDHIPPLTQTIAAVEEEWHAGVILKASDEENRIIGSVRGRVKGNTLYVGKPMVRPDLQGQGIGTALLKEIERVCPQNRCELFTSTKSAKNIRLYENMGYRVFSEVPVSDHLTFVYLEKYTN
jgi:GNAT superfamily N-acetyltransferase